MKRQWIRLYTSVLNDPKILVLPDRLFRFWANCLLASGLSGDCLPVPSRLKILMRISERQTIANLKSLAEFGLAEETPDGWKMHDWEEHQYDSDFSRERMQRHRDGQKTVTVTVQSRAEQKADAEAEQKLAAAAAAGPPANGIEAILAEAFTRIAEEGVELPPRYLTNEYGKQERNPASERLDGVLRAKRGKILAARKPAALARKIILDELA